MGASFHFSGFDLSLVEKDPKNQTKTKGKKNREWFSENCAKEKFVKRLQRFNPKNDNCRRENGFCQVGSSKRNTVNFPYVFI